MRTSPVRVAMLGALIALIGWNAPCDSLAAQLPVADSSNAELLGTWSGDGRGPVLAVALEGKDAIEVTRNLMGATNAAKAAPGTIRGDFGMSFSNNLVHGSDGPESATTELALFFPDAEEICEWTPVDEPWVYSVEER